VQGFRGGLVFQTDRLCVSLNSRLESNNEEEEVRNFHEKSTCRPQSTLEPYAVKFGHVALGYPSNETREFHRVEWVVLRESIQNNR